MAFGMKFLYFKGYELGGKAVDILVGCLLYTSRSCLPDGPKVGSVAVSPRGDLRMPSDASPTAWL